MNGHEGNRNKTQGCLCAGAAGVWGCARVVYGELVEAQDGRGWHPCGLCAGQSVVLSSEGDAARAALPAQSDVSGEAPARDARHDLRCGGGHPQGLTAVRPVGRRGALGGEQEAALHPARLCAWLHHADGRCRGAVQGRQLLRARVRRQHPLGRPGDWRRMAD